MLFANISLQKIILFVNHYCIQSDKHLHSVHALLDDKSYHSYIEKTLVEELKLNVYVRVYLVVCRLMKQITDDAI